MTSTLETNVLHACKNLDSVALKSMIAPHDFRNVINKIIEDMDPTNPKVVEMLAIVFQNNTHDANFSTPLCFYLTHKDYDLARLILKYSPATVTTGSLLPGQAPPDDIYRECAVRAVRKFTEDDFGFIPEILCRVESPETMIAILQEIPQDYDVDKHFMDALMYPEHPNAIEFAVDRFMGANPNLAANVITFILSGEVQNLDHLIVPLLHKYPPTLEHQQWISRSIRPNILPLPVLDELLKYYIVEDNARLLTEASATQNPVVFSKVVELFTEEQVRATVANPINKAIKLFSLKTFDLDRKLLVEHVQHLDNVKQQEILLDNIHFNKTTNPVRKM